MAAVADRVTVETNQHYQRINTADVYLTMVTDQVDSEFPSDYSLSDAISEIRNHDDESVTTELREQSDLIASGKSTMPAWVADVRQRLIDCRMEAGS